MTKNKLLLSILLIALIFFLFAFNYLIFPSGNIKNKENNSIIENNETLNEINRLLLPLASKTITESDFTKLKTLAKSDSYATDELEELTVLTKYKEYSHVGHGLGFLYEYIKTGKEQICPGHNLAHYYVFTKHGENELAQNNLNEARQNIPDFGPSAYYKMLFENTLASINAGNTTATNDQISELADAPCIK